MMAPARIFSTLTLGFAFVILTSVSAHPWTQSGQSAEQNEKTAAKMKLGQSKAAADAGTNPNRFVREGIAVEFAAAPATGGTGKEPTAGENVEVKFRLSDVGSGTPLNRSYPSAWIDISRTMEARSPQTLTCEDKVSLYLQGIVGIRPMIDLNQYFLLVLNKDPSISVIDPITGISGKTNLYATISLKSSGADWAKTRDNKRLYLTMPRVNQVAVIDTDTFKVVGNIDTGENPVRAALQADGKYLWIGNDGSGDRDGGVTAIDTDSSKAVANIATGKGHHEIVFSADDRYVFVSNRDGGTVTVIDVPQLRKIKDLETGPLPISLAYSPLSRAVYVADAKDGVISVVDSLEHKILARIQAKPGLGPVRFTPDGRWGLAVNSAEKAILVVDAATNRLAHTIPMHSEPYQIALTSAFAHVRSLDTERVSMINLTELAKGVAQPPNTYAAGASAPKREPELGLSKVIAPAVGDAAVYVASPADNAIYYYMEGMNAPSGSFQTYGHTAMGVEIIDRSLQEREAGVYSTTIRPPVAGTYDVAFLLDSPRMVHCFSFTAQANPALKRVGPALGIEYLTQDRKFKVGDDARLSFRLTDPVTGQSRTGLKDVRVLYYLVPGILRREVAAQETSDGNYEAILSLPRAGAYYVYVASAGDKVRYADLPYFSLIVEQDLTLGLATIDN